MIGIHTLWSKPYFYKNDNPDYYLKDYDLLVMLISILKWKEKNGRMLLFADEFSKNLLEEYNLSCFYDEINDLKVDDCIKPQVFWAAGKLYALKSMNEPCALIDIDLVCWEDISINFNKYDICAMHTEELLDKTYKNKDYFRMESGYIFPENLNWKAQPVNTALLYIRDMSFKNYYLEKSIDFMKNTLENRDSLHYMVFAEQRLLSMTAEIKDKEIKTMLKFPEDIGNQRVFTHLWGFKTMLNESPEVRKRFCLRCIRRLNKDYPYCIEKIKNIPSLKYYF